MAASTGMACILPSAFMYGVGIFQGGCDDVTTGLGGERLVYYWQRGFRRPPSPRNTAGVGSIYSMNNHVRSLASESSHNLNSLNSL